MNDIVSLKDDAIRSIVNILCCDSLVEINNVLRKVDMFTKANLLIRLHQPNIKTDNMNADVATVLEQLEAEGYIVKAPRVYVRDTFNTRAIVYWFNRKLLSTNSENEG